MRAILFAVLLMTGVAAGTLRAEEITDRDHMAEWQRRAYALLQSLIGLPRPERDVIVPPADIDPTMARRPPQPDGTMRIIRPPGGPGDGGNFQIGRK
jgi:hypothetical protein